MKAKGVIARSRRRRGDLGSRRELLDQEKRTYVTGKVSYRQCPVCGHPEVGLVLEDGSFHALNPGMTLAVPSPYTEPLAGQHSACPVSPGESEQVDKRLWVPEPVRGDKGLRLKYGVMVNERLLEREMSGALYEASYMAKLESLIQGEKDVPLPVILDRVFAAPQLASGNPQQVCKAMWRELEEVRQPVRLVRAWLEKGDEESLTGLIHPRTKETLGREPADDERLMRELQELSLEDFLEML